VHNVVRERRVGSRHVHAAVFPDLPAGRYVPYDSDIAKRYGSFDVSGGTITEIDWR
jgi:hypothetical protein